MSKEDKVDYSKYFVVDPESPTGLRWRDDRGKIKAGDVAGYIEGGVRPVVTLLGKDYDCHRVIWEMVNGKIPEGKRIIYIDGDKSNNCISNLKIQEAKEKSKPVEIVRLTEKEIWSSKLFSGIKTRCGFNGVEITPYYEGFGVYEPWLKDRKLFHDFIITVENHDATDFEGKPFNVEKDLFSYNNPVRKGYYPENICFLPRDLNQVIQLEHPRQRLDGRVLPLGVTKDGNRYKAQISINGKIKYLGSSTDMWECAELYKIAKIARIQELHEIWRDRLPERVNNQLELFVNDLKAHREIISANDT